MFFVLDPECADGVGVVQCPAPPSRSQDIVTQQPVTTSIATTTTEATENNRSNIECHPEKSGRQPQTADNVNKEGMIMNMKTVRERYDIKVCQRQVDIRNGFITNVQNDQLYVGLLSSLVEHWSSGLTFSRFPTAASLSYVCNWSVVYNFCIIIRQMN